MRDHDEQQHMMNRDRNERDERDRGAFFSDRDDHRRDSDGDDRDRGRSHRDSGGSGSHDDRHGSRFESRDRSRRDEEDARFGPDDFNRGIPMDETRRLIASNKVEGTPVYDRHGDKLGTIHNFMVDKYKGEVIYAVMKHSGGFLGLGERYFPLEWCDLTFDTRLEGYHVPMTEEDLDNRVSFDSNGRPVSGRKDRERHGSDRDRGGW